MDLGWELKKGTQPETGHSADLHEVWISEHFIATAQCLFPGLMESKWWTMCLTCGLAVCNVTLLTVEIEFKRHFFSQPLLCRATHKT